MNKELVYSEILKGSLKQLDQLDTDLEKIREYKINQHFQTLFGSDDEILKELMFKCRFEGGTVLSRLLNVNYVNDNCEYDIGLGPDEVTIEDYNQNVVWTVTENNIECHSGYVKVDDKKYKLDSSVNDLTNYLWNQYKSYVRNEEYLNDERSRDSEDEVWDEFMNNGKYY